MTNSELRTNIGVVVASLVQNQTPFTAWDVTKLVRKDWAGPNKGVAHPKVKSYVRSLFEMGDMEGYVKSPVMVGKDLEDAILYHPECSDPTMHPAVAVAQKELRRQQEDEAERDAYTCFSCGADFDSENFPPTQTDDGPLCPECAESHAGATPRGPLGGPAVILPPVPVGEVASED